MLASKEIRWFFEKENKEITKWFLKKNLTITTTKPRTDYYKKLNQDNLSIKLCQGTIEIKERIGKVTKKQMGKFAFGFIENCVKWSINVKLEDLQTKEIIYDENPEWIAVTKNRIGLKITHDANGNYLFLPTTDCVDYGCHIEYARIQANGKFLYSFGLEWFGDKYIDIDTTLIDEISNTSILGCLESFGYAEFLKRL
jgi:hypothetical protein